MNPKIRKPWIRHVIIYFLLTVAVQSSIVAWAIIRLHAMRLSIDFGGWAAHANRYVNYTPYYIPPKPLGGSSDDLPVAFIQPIGWNVDTLWGSCTSLKNPSLHSAELLSSDWYARKIITQWDEKLFQERFAAAIGWPLKNIILESDCDSWDRDQEERVGGWAVGKGPLPWVWSRASVDGNSFAIDFILTFTIIGSVHQSAIWARRRVRRSRGMCENCGYPSLRPATCPECGKVPKS